MKLRGFLVIYQMYPLPLELVSLGAPKSSNWPLSLWRATCTKACSFNVDLYDYLDHLLPVHMGSPVAYYMRRHVPRTPSQRPRRN